MLVWRRLGVLLVLALILGGWRSGIGTGQGGGGGQPGVYYVSPGGSDGNDGKTLANAWASPNHPLNCGDVVHMQAGTYNAANVAAGQWGAVANCPSTTTGSYFATLVCDGPFVQDCNVPGSGGSVVQVTASNWQIKHVYAQANYAGGKCFAAGDGTMFVHHIAFIDVYAKNCGAGIQSDKVDYVAYVGFIAYGGDVVGQCFKGYTQNHPVNLDNFSGTHNFTAGGFVLNTASTAGCGDAVLLQQWDHGDDTSLAYTGQGAVEQSLVIGNAAWCVIPHAVSAPLFIDHVSCWGNAQGADRGQNSELILSFSNHVTVSNSIFQATIAQAAGATGTPACATTANGAVFGAIYNQTTAPADAVSNSYVFGVGGQNECTWPASIPPTRTGVTNASPGFAGAQQIGAAPNCATAATVTSCIAGLRANFVPSGGAAALGYQPPGSCTADSRWPTWLLVSDIPAGLVTTPCPGPVLAITTPANGASINGPLDVNAICLPACTQVVFQVDGSTFATDTAAPYAASFDTTTIANGAHTVTAIGTNALGTTPTTIAVNVNNAGAGPTVAITTPANNATVTGTITATATCTASCTQVVFQMDGTAFATLTASPYTTTFDTTTKGNGAHTLAAVGTNAGGSQTASISLTFNNAAPSFTGRGDIVAQASFSDFASYGGRAYSAAFRGNKQYQVCVQPNDVCQDMFSSSTTGDLVPQTINGVQCPNTLQNSCTVRIAYDIAHPGGGTYDLVQTVPGNRPWLMAKAMPVIGNNRACLYFPDASTAFMTNGGAGGFPTAPFTYSAVVMNAAPVGSNSQGPMRLNVNVTGNQNAFGDGAGGHGIGFQVIDSSNNMFAKNQLNLYHGSFGSGSVYATDHVGHAVQAVVGSSAGSSSTYIDDLSTSGLSVGTTTTAGVAMGQNSSANRFIGVLCEASIAAGDRSSINNTMNDNQTAWWLAATSPSSATQAFTSFQDFDNAALGSITLQAAQNLWPVGSNGVTRVNNWNYVHTSDNSPCIVQSTGQTQDSPPQNNSNCTIGNPVAWTVVAGGPSVGGNMIQNNQPTGYLGGQFTGYGSAALETILGGTFNALVVEYDEQIPSGISRPQGASNGGMKTGTLPYFQDPVTGNLMNAENDPQNCIPGQSGSCASATAAYTTFIYNTDRVNSGSGGFAGAAVNSSFVNTTVAGGNFAFNLQFNTWYHYRVTVAIGPQGFYRNEVDLNDGRGLRPYSGYSRFNCSLSNPSIGCAQNPSTGNRAFALVPHYGGGNANDACGAGTTSKICRYNLDNIRITGYQR